MAKTARNDMGAPPAARPEPHACGNREASEGTRQQGRQQVGERVRRHQAQEEEDEGTRSARSARQQRG